MPLLPYLAAVHSLVQRQALLDAAKLAGLNVMGLIHNHAGAAPGSITCGFSMYAC